MGLSETVGENHPKCHAESSFCLLAIWGVYAMCVCVCVWHIDIMIEE